MKIRPAKEEELCHLATIGTQAFKAQAVYKHLYPFQDEYPTDFYESILMSLQKTMVTRGHIVYLIELEDGDRATLPVDLRCIETQLIGFATFKCFGSPEKRDYWNTDSEEKRLRLKDLLKKEQEKPNRAVNKQSFIELQEGERRILGGLDNALEAGTFAIDPLFRGLGIGAEVFGMAQHIINQQGMEMVFSSSEAALPLYIKGGCKLLGSVKLSRKVLKQGDVELTVPETIVPVFRCPDPRRAITPRL